MAAGAIEVLDSGALRRWADGACELLRAHREEIDGINVYPVADGDTGTNMLLTWESVAAAARAVPDGERDGLAATTAAMARGALLGARGSSGAILSQVVRGLAEVLGSAPLPGGADLARALQRASEAAYEAVAVPVEGTLLTVLREAAAGAAAGGGDLADVVRRACSRASAALTETTGQMAALARAGVVDAGARGLVVLLEALQEVVTGDLAVLPRIAPRRHVDAAPVAEAGPAYEVQYLLAADDAAVAVLRAALAGLGDSLVVTGGEGLWNVHVHVDDVAAAIERGLEAGRPSRLSVTRFADQVG